MRLLLLFFIISSFFVLPLLLLLIVVSLPLNWKKIEAKQNKGKKEKNMSIRNYSKKIFVAATIL